MKSSYFVDRNGVKVFFTLRSENGTLFVDTTTNGTYFFTVHYTEKYIWKVNKNSISSFLNVDSLVKWFYKNPVYLSATIQKLFY